MLEQAVAEALGHGGDISVVAEVAEPPADEIAEPAGQEPDPVLPV